MPGEVVPFGKYKGQPVEMLAADTGYAEWLLSQPWFRQRYGNVYTILLNYGGEPQDSPEHNQMQAWFLDDAHCLGLAALLFPKFADASGQEVARRCLAGSALCREFRESLQFTLTPPSIRNRQFEDRGWDVSFSVVPASIEVRGPLPDHLPACICQCDHGGCPPESPCQGGDDGGSPRVIVGGTIEDSWRCRHRQHDDHRNAGGGDLRGGVHDHCTAGCPWGAGGPMRDLAPKDENSAACLEAWSYAPDTKARWLQHVARSGISFGLGYLPPIHIELKPDLGDDYPAVLRQVKGYCRSDGSSRCVVVRRRAFEVVTWEQVRKIFAASAITLLAEDEIEAASDPDEQALALVKQRLGGEVVTE
jgi:hypothetical protein